MRDWLLSRLISLLAIILLAATTPIATARAQDSNSKARALVDAAIKMTNSDQAVKLLWQAIEIDPTLQDAYVYLGVYYQSRSDFTNLAKVYEKFVKYHPEQVSGYLNVGEAYMSFSPPKSSEALVWYRKAYQIDPKSSYAALRIGEILAQNGTREEAIRYLRQALADSGKSPEVSRQAEKTLREMGAL